MRLASSVLTNTSNSASGNSDGESRSYVSINRHGFRRIEIHRNYIGWFHACYFPILNFDTKNCIAVNKHQQHIAVKGQDYITYTPPVAHAVVYKVGGYL